METDCFRLIINSPQLCWFNIIVQLMHAVPVWQAADTPEIALGFETGPPSSNENIGDVKLTEALMLQWLRLLV